ncbi:hypothetical protein CPB86DRAFT_877235 [Serendipita vermifera]|nr:hypothetical protein CPB86DRAFT_877235 [Serendipita vermifera]
MDSGSLTPYIHSRANVLPSTGPRTRVTSTSPSFRTHRRTTSSIRTSVVSPSSPRQPNPNRIPSEEEAAHLQRIIELDREEIEILTTRIEKRSSSLSLSIRMVSDIEKSLQLARSLQRAREERIGHNLHRVLQLKEAEKSVTEDMSDETQETRSTEVHLRDMLGQIQEELERLNTVTTLDMDENEEALAKIKQLEQKLVETRARLDAEESSIIILGTCRTEMMANLNSKLQMFTSGRRLPNEVLVEIFKTCLAMQLDSVRANPPGPRSRIVPLLATICRKWRRIVLGIPSLWAYIPASDTSPFTDIPLPVRMDSHFQRALSSRHLILDWPLEHLAYLTSVRVLPPLLTTMASTAYISPALEAAECIELIVRHGPGSWRSLLCPGKASKYILRGILPQFTPEGMSQVQELSIHIQTLGDTPLRSFLANLSNLKSLALLVGDEKVTTVTHGSAFNTSWLLLNNLTRLETSPNTLLALIEIIISAPNIQHLVIHGPANGTHVAPHFLLDAWDRYLHRSNLGARIRTLTFKNSPSLEYTTSHFIPIANGFPYLTMLELEGGFLSTVFAPRGHLRHARLASLRLTDCDIDGNELNTVVQMRKRTNALANITKVELMQCSNVLRHQTDVLAKEIEELCVYC